MWITQAATCHHFRDQMYLQNTWNITKMITLFSIIIHHSHRCFQYYIYMLLTSFSNMFLIPWHLRIFQHIHHHQHGDCRLLSNGMSIWHLECCHCLTSVLGRRPQPDHPRHSFRACLHPLLLDKQQPHLMPTTWGHPVWMFCHYTKHSFHTAAIISRWMLWECIRLHRPTYPIKEDTLHTPCPELRTCVFWPNTHHTTQTSHNIQQSSTHTYQTSVPPPILQ